MSRLRLRGVGCSYGSTRVLHEVDLDVPSGSLLAVLGPSGCGKTTMLRVVAGFEPADAGEVLVGERLVAGPGVHVPPEGRGVAMVPQEGALFPHLDVAGNVGFGLPRRGRGRAARVAELLELVGLADLASRRPTELSGGQQQRVALARALAPHPELVLLDEPFSALDAGLRAQVREEVREVLHAAGATAVLVTHDQDEALSTADLVAVMDRGTLRQVGPPDVVYREPVDAVVAATVGEVCRLAGHARDGQVVTALGALGLRAADEAAGGDGTALVRPEQLRLSAAGTSGAGVVADVLAVRFHGHDSTVRLRLPGAVEVVCRTQDPVPVGPTVRVDVVGPVAFAG